MLLYPLGITRRKDVALAAEQSAVERVAVRWVLAGELAVAAIDPPQGPPKPLEHAAALEAIHRRMCVLPVRFGTVLGGEAEIRSLLESRRRDLLERLDRLEGTCEMGLRIELPERPATLPHLSLVASSSVSYLHQRRAHYQGQDALSARAHRKVERVVRELHGTYREWRRLTPTPPCVVRLAFLVERKHIAAFQQRCQASRRERPGEQQTVLGPWPPYSFV